MQRKSKKDSLWFYTIGARTNDLPHMRRARESLIRCGYGNSNVSYRIKYITLSESQTVNKNKTVALPRYF